MKKTYSLIVAGAMFQMCAAAQQTPRYTVTDLGTLGGAYSYSYAMTNGGLVAGGSATAPQSGGVAQTAFLWGHGSILNLGTLDGAACPGCNSEAAASAANGNTAVISEIATPDPNGEDFCGFGTHLECVAAIWKNGVMTALPKLPGGINSQVYSMNNGGDAAGFSETGVNDPTCGYPFQVRRFEAVKWSHDGQVHELAPLAGDTVGFAFAINQNGEAVGASGVCANTSLPPNGAPVAPHAVLWEKDGHPLDLGGLPGAVAYVATGLNERTDVVGNAVFADGSVHPFLWTRSGGMRDLGNAPGDFQTVAGCCNTINNRGDVVAFSCPGPFGSCRAVVWSNNTWTDLNTLLVPGTTLYVVNAAAINDSGQIAGTAVTASGEVHAVVVSPRP